MDCSVCNFNALTCSVAVRQIQTPEDDHIGPKRVVLKENKGEKNCCITNGIYLHELFNLTCLLC
jgi:hypothetical protein